MFKKSAKYSILGFQKAMFYTQINNRRYLGNKYRILPFIKKNQNIMIMKRNLSHRGETHEKETYTS